jgi:hypothetical protein
MRRSLPLVAVVLAALVSAPPAGGQPTPAPDSPPNVRPPRWGATLTAFRNPGTGLELHRGPVAVFAAHYPTVIRRDGRSRSTSFARLGAAWVFRDRAATAPYVSASWAASLTRGWDNSLLGEAGIRQRLARGGTAHRLTGRLGAAVLVAPSTRATRVNPTIGLGFDL